MREVSDADGVHRAAFRELTSAGDFTPSSFSSLLEAVRRLDEAVRRLEDVERTGDAVTPNAPRSARA